MTKNLNAKQFIKQYPKELHPTAEKKMKCCDIISSDWLKKLEKSLKSPLSHIPKNFSKSIEDLVDSNGDLLPNLIRGTDYDLVTCFMFDNLSQFACKSNSDVPREIRCGLGLDPKSGDEVVAFDLVSFNVKLIQCNKRSSGNRAKSNSEKIFASSSWKFHDFLNLFCELMKFDAESHRFYHDSELEEQIELSLPISSRFKGSTKRSTAYDLYFGPLQKSRERNENNKTQINSLNEKEKNSNLTNDKMKRTSLNEKESNLNLTNDKMKRTNLNENTKSKMKNEHFDEQIKTETPNENVHKRSNSTVMQYKLSNNLTVPKLELVGFVNLENTCYINSVVQCFIRIPQISSFYFGNKYAQYINLNNSLSSHGQISNEFHNILINIASQQYSKQTYTLKKFISAFVNQYNQFNSRDQQDAQEFLICLIDGLHEDINQAFRSNKDRKKVLETFSPNESPWEVCKKLNKSQIYNLLLGMTETKLTCQICSRVETVQEPFVVLSLPLPPSGSNSAQLEDCLKRYCQNELLTKGEKIECTKCKKKTNANRVLKIERCSDIFIIALKRFENSGNSTFKKNDINIIYPDILYMNEFSSHNIGKFKLIGCVYHYGSLEGGHYTAASLDQLRRKWYLFDDSSVDPILEKNVHNRNAYILFYQKE